MDKTSLSELSIIFSIKIDSFDRLENLKLNIEYFETYFYNYEIVIVEQDVESRLNELLKNKEYIKHYFIASKDAHYKTRNLNFATNLATREIIMMCDCDVICPVEALILSLNKLRLDVAFVSPHNGLLVELKKSFFKEKKDLRHIIGNLKFFPKDFNLRLSDFDFSEMVPLYGSSYYNSTGGCIFYRKKEFYLIGGWNLNIVSYGFEDMEFTYRLKKLGYKLEILENYNIYHLEHERLVDSVYNNFYRSNEVEWMTINSMTESELKEYALNGFRKIEFDNSKEINIVNTTNKFSIELYNNDKIDLYDLSIILPLWVENANLLIYLNTFLNYLENYFTNYEVIMVEAEFRNCKYLGNKKNVKYFWLGTEGFVFEKAIEYGTSKSTKRFIGIWDFLSLIDPIKLEEAIISLRRKGTNFELKDVGWHVKGIKKLKKGSGLILYHKGTRYNKKISIMKSIHAAILVWKNN